MTVSGPMFFVGLRFAAAAIVVGFFSLRTLRDLTLFELKAGVFIGVAIMFGYGLKSNEAPAGPVNSINPANASMMPMLGINPGRRPSTSHCSSGTKGTYSAVINADWLLRIV